MSRRKMSEGKKTIIAGLIEEYNIQSAAYPFLFVDAILFRPN